MPKLLDGIFTAAITPFTAENDLDLTALKANVKRWNKYGLHGFVVNGSTGEGALLTDAERRAVIETVRQTMSDGMMLIAGTGRESTAQTILACQHAASAGADAGLVITPSFYAPLMTGPALENHYVTIADASSIPILIYVMPFFTGVNVSPETVITLAEHPNIIGVKDSSGNGQALSTIIRHAPADFAVFSGNAPTFAQALISGASGGILAVANLVPEICVALHRAANAQNFSEMQHLHNLLVPISEVVGGEYAIGGLKYAMRLLDYAAGVPRPPLSDPTEAQREKISAALHTAGLLDMKI